MKKNLLIVILFFLANHHSIAQDRAYAQDIIDTLSSATFHGRGYVFKGDRRAGRFIRKQMKEAGLEPLVPDYFHHFQVAVNTFPGELTVSTGGQDLIPGREFIVDPSSAPMDATLEPVLIREADLMNNRKCRQLTRKKYDGQVVIIDTLSKTNKEALRRQKLVLSKFKGKALILLSNDLTWAVGRSVLPYTLLKVDGKKVGIGQFNTENAVQINVESKFLNHYKTFNVCGMIKGSRRADSMVFFTAHYDHLGRMGKDTYIPGANDNASGVAMMLDMARYFKENPPEYTLVFVAFAGEEAGLVGSYNFVKDMKGFLNPNKIKFVINMDLMGSGEKGIMAVNGKVYTDDFEVLKAINDDKKYLPVVKSRGKAANSDHYFFSESGIPAFFFYLRGEYSYYHEVDDSAENLRLSEYYDKSFLLIRDFLEALQTE